jgi:hypothetical protein
MMQPTLVTEVSGATIELSMGLYTVRFHPETVLDVEAVQRIERARRAVLPGVEGPVLMVVAVTAVEVDREALEWLGSEEGMAGVPARAVVVPSTIHVGLVPSCGGIPGVPQRPGGKRLGTRCLVRPHRRPRN